VSCSRGYWCSDEHPTSPGCGKHFRTVDGFARHRVGETCLSSAALVGKGWRRDADGFWVSPRDRLRRGKPLGGRLSRAGRSQKAAGVPGGQKGAGGGSARSETDPPTTRLERALHDARVLQALEPGLRAAELARRGTTWREHYRALLEALGDPRAREILGQVTHTRLLAAAEDALRYPPRERPLPGQLPLEGTR
jgi:hypothetical protein